MEPEPAPDGISANSLRWHSWLESERKGGETLYLLSLFISLAAVNINNMYIRYNLQIHAVQTMIRTQSYTFTLFVCVFSAAVTE